MQLKDHVSSHAGNLTRSWRNSIRIETLVGNRSAGMTTVEEEDGNLNLINYVDFLDAYYVLGK
ncbi:hypothetical protein DPMN_084344 [Dreissena polymorpha]|uniref:Uncharacterized protein n=1 Tax=Dreissena polymorpha TaxID=45954 RepID=A0A9D4BJA6_DREPO|nr:hypothetical protein DPMN_084344 [Dreissena polymorpha]